VTLSANTTDYVTGKWILGAVGALRLMGLARQGGVGLVRLRGDASA
jgi:hypothetical protein